MPYTNYWTRLKSQRNSANITSGLRTYLQFLYGFFQSEVSKFDKILEIGSGAGTSLSFLQSSKIVRTDILDSDDPRILGKVDIHSLPFDDSTFDLIIGMDVLHHLQYPFKGLDELRRVLSFEQNPGVIRLIEPYVSPFSYLPYRIFHTEQTSLIEKRKLIEPLVGSKPEEGDQTIPRLIFCSKKGRRRLAAIFPPERYLISIEYLSVISFFATGGINRPLPTPSIIIRGLIKIEGLLPQFMMKYAASRVIITIRAVSLVE